MLHNVFKVVEFDLKNIVQSKISVACRCPLAFVRLVEATHVAKLEYYAQPMPQGRATPQDSQPK